MLVINYEEIEYELEYPFRMFISGSSQCGKTTFAGSLLQSSFFPNVSSVHYYHPDYLEKCPVNWHHKLNIPVCYKTNLPTLDELCKLPENSCVVLDDLYEECINSKAMDYLFRVLSGKKRISVMIMSQRYFAKGKFALSIRNNVNYTVLMRNTDSRVNKIIASQLNIVKQYEKCDFKTMYPNVFIDNSPRASVSGYRVYQDIIGRYPILVTDEQMKRYLLPEKDFLEHFSQISPTLAVVKHENKKDGAGHEESRSETQTLPESTKYSRDEIREKLQERAKRLRMARKTREIISRNKEHPKLFSKNN